jgi:hypothetical protein
VGRWPGDDVPDGQERYKLPAKFQKSRVLFNLHRVPEGEHVVLVEGYWSAIRLHALGIPIAALMSWSVSPEQIALLRESGIRFVTLLLDGARPAGAVANGCCRSYRARSLSGRRSYPMEKSPTRCRNNSCAKWLILVSGLANEASGIPLTAWLNKTGSPKPELVHTRPPLAAVFVEVRYPREPAGAAAAREDALCAAEWLAAASER